jgi:hypothetical protein
LETGSDFSFVEVAVEVAVAVAVAVEVDDDDDRVRRNLNRCDGEAKALISIIMLATSFQRITEPGQRRAAGCSMFNVQCDGLFVCLTL